MLLLAAFGVTELVSIWQEATDINFHWKKRTYEFDHSDEWLNQCPPQEVRMQWHAPPGWIDILTMDLQAKIVSGGSGNGISFSAPFALLVNTSVKPQGATLTDDQIILIKSKLSQLPAGDIARASASEYSGDFRVAFYKDGAVQVNHYPANRLPQALFELAKALQLHMPEQGN